MSSIFKPLKMTFSELSKLPIKEGQLITITDAQEMYLDKSDTVRVKIGEVTGSIPIGIASNLTAVSGDAQATIKWTDPSDLTVEGKTWAAWGGTKLVIKEGGYPSSPYDGTMILDSKTRNQYSLTGYSITGLTNEKTYYGALFPYSISGYINTSDKNRFTIAPGYVYPSAATNIVLTPNPSENKIRVTFNLPTDAVDATVVFKEGSAPNSSTDGWYVSGVTSAVTATNLAKDVTYYFRVYTRNSAGRETASDTYTGIIESLKIVTFADGTDEEIAAMLDAHYAGDINISDYWSVGDTRKIHLNSLSFADGSKTRGWSEQDITIVITEMNYSNLATSINGKTKAAITCQTREMINNGAITFNLTNSYIMDTSQAHWSNVGMRSFLNGTFLNNAMPSGIKSMIKPITHTVLATRGCSGTGHNATPANRTTENVTDTIFLPTYTEIFGNVAYNSYLSGETPNSEEGTQWAYFQTQANVTKYINDNGSPSGSSFYWWEGSPATSYYGEGGGYCWCVAGWGDYNTSYPFYLAPAFAM